MTVQEASGAARSSHQLSVVVLTFNSEKTIEVLLRAVKSLSPHIVVVDSFSTDSTERIVKHLGGEFVQHAFENYSDQRRWSEEYMQLPADSWVWHLDSDEIPSSELIASVRSVLETGQAEVTGYLMKRLSYFWGHPIRHGHMNPNWHLRLYRSGRARCENRLYDQHFVTAGQTAKLNGELIDLQLVSLTAWTASHNRWSSAEAEEGASKGIQFLNGDRLKPSLSGDLREKKRWVKQNVWYKLPLLSRPFLMFFYNYIIKGGILDGQVGFVYHVLHAFWFRFLVDAKILELEKYGSFLETGLSDQWLAAQGVRLD